MCELEPGMIDPEAPKIRCISVTHSEMGGGYILPLDEAVSIVIDEFPDMEAGESLTLTLCLMTQEEFDALPEFEGW